MFVCKLDAKCLIQKESDNFYAFHFYWIYGAFFFFIWSYFYLANFLTSCYGQHMGNPKVGLTHRPSLIMGAILSDLTWAISVAKIPKRVELRKNWPPSSLATLSKTSLLNLVWIWSHFFPKLTKAWKRNGKRNVKPLAYENAMTDWRELGVSL